MIAATARVHALQMATRNGYVEKGPPCLSNLPAREMQLDSLGTEIKPRDFFSSQILRSLSRSPLTYAFASSKLSNMRLPFITLQGRQHATKLRPPAFG